MRSSSRLLLFFVFFGLVLSAPLHSEKNKKSFETGNKNDIVLLVYEVQGGTLTYRIVPIGKDGKPMMNGSPQMVETVNFITIGDPIPIKFDSDFDLQRVFQGKDVYLLEAPSDDPDFQFFMFNIL